MERTVDCVVVGAGIAGLVAATALQAHGVTVVCCEARDRVGGRAWSPGGWFDLGATWFWDGQSAIAETVDAVRLATYPQILDGDALFEQASGERARLTGNPIDRPGWRLAGGMQAVAVELARRLAPGTVQTGAAVRSISVEGERIVVATDGATIGASTAILGVPPALAVDAIAFSPELPTGIVDAGRAVHTWMSDTVKVVAHYAEPFWRDAGYAGAALSHRGPFCEFHDHSGPERHQAALFGFAPAGILGGVAPEEIAAQFTHHAARLWGDDAKDVIEVHVADWSTDPFTSASTPSRPSSGWYYGTPVLRLPHLDGRLVFGSTETAPAFPGYLEGAVLAGRRAAGQVLERP
jgi:monoamine oxidase